jgi:hypothetical protein
MAKCLGRVPNYSVGVPGGYDVYGGFGGYGQRGYGGYGAQAVPIVIQFDRTVRDHTQLCLAKCLGLVHIWSVGVPYGNFVYGRFGGYGQAGYGGYGAGSQPIAG